MVEHQIESAPVQPRVGYYVVQVTYLTHGGMTKQGEVEVRAAVAADAIAAAADDARRNKDCKLVIKAEAERKPKKR